MAVDSHKKISSPHVLPELFVGLWLASLLRTKDIARFTFRARSICTRGFRWLSDRIVIPACSIALIALLLTPLLAMVVSLGPYARQLRLFAAPALSYGRRGARCIGNWFAQRIVIPICSIVLIALVLTPPLAMVVSFGPYALLDIKLPVCSTTAIALVLSSLLAMIHSDVLHANALGRRGICFVASNFAMPVAAMRRSGRIAAKGLIVVGDNVEANWPTPDMCFLRDHFCMFRREDRLSINDIRQSMGHYQPGIF